MSHSALESDSFITSLIHKLSSLTCPPTPFPENIVSSPSSSSNPNSLHPDPSRPAPSPSKPPTFSTILSALLKEKQESVIRLLTTLHFLFPHEFIPALDLLDRGLVTRMVITLPLTTTTVPDTNRADHHGAHYSSTTQPELDATQAASAHSTTSKQDSDPETNPRLETDSAAETENELLYVQSASPQNPTNTNRHRRRQQPSSTSTTYEVRLPSWNCTCPAFALSAFGRMMDLNPDDGDGDRESREKRDPPTAEETDSRGHDERESGAALVWKFGGSLTRTSSDREPSGRETPIPVPVCKHILAALLGKHVPGLFGYGVQLRRVSLEEGAAWAAGWGDGD